MNIIKLDTGLRKKAAAVLAASFFDYPMFTFYFPDVERRSRNLPWYMDNVLKCAINYGEAYVTEDISGVIFILPPGHNRISTWEYIQNGFLLIRSKMGREQFRRSEICEDFVAQTQDEIMRDRPHYYLWGLAVDPAHKRKGVGKALLTPSLEKATSQKLPFYLETHDEKNVAYYQQFGFKLARATAIPEFGIPLWCMVWEPE